MSAEVPITHFSTDVNNTIKTRRSSTFCKVCHTTGFLSYSSWSATTSVRLTSQEFHERHFVVSERGQLGNTATRHTTLLDAALYTNAHYNIGHDCHRQMAQVIDLVAACLMIVRLPWSPIMICSPSSKYRKSLMPCC